MKVPESLDGDIYMDFLVETPSEEITTLRKQITESSVIASLKEGDIELIDYLPLELVIQVLAQEVYELKKQKS